MEQQDQCEAMNFCTSKCKGKECANQIECETIGGYCDDPDAILESIEVFLCFFHNNTSSHLLTTLVQYATQVFPTLEGAKTGVCVKPIQPFNNPQCPYVTEYVVAQPGALDTRTGNSYDFTTHRGYISIFGFEIFLSIAHIYIVNSHLFAVVLCFPIARQAAHDVAAAQAVVASLQLAAAAHPPQRNVLPNHHPAFGCPCQFRSAICCCL